MSASMAGFVLNDAAIKLATDDIPVFQAILIRGVFAMILLGGLAWARGAFRYRLGGKDVRLIGWRTVLEVTATLAFLTALVHMPIADITAILQTLPLTIALGAAVFLAEPIGWRRIVAILIGFVGVLLIIRPGSDVFSVYSLLGLLAVATVTGRDLIVRRLSKTVPTFLVAFITATGIAFAGGLAMLVTDGWQPVDLATIAMLGVASLFIVVGYFYSIAAMRIGEVAFVTPFRYTIMIWALILGWFIWGDVPDALTWIGITIVVGTGMFTLWREQRAR